MEGKNAITWTRRSCKRFHDREVRLQIHALAYNLCVFIQGLDLPEEIAGWSLASIQSRLIKIGVCFVRHGRKITFPLAEVAASGLFLRQIIDAIRNLKPPRGLCDCQSKKSKHKRLQSCVLAQPKWDKAGEKL